MRHVRDVHRTRRLGLIGGEKSSEVLRPQIDKWVKSYAGTAAGPGAAEKAESYGNQDQWRPEYVRTACADFVSHVHGKEDAAIQSIGCAGMGDK